METLSGVRRTTQRQRPATLRASSTCASLDRTSCRTVTGGWVCSSVVDLNHQTVLISFHFVILMQIHYFPAIKKPFCLMVSNCVPLNIWLGQSVRVILVCVLWPALCEPCSRCSPFSVPALQAWAGSLGRGGVLCAQWWPCWGWRLPHPHGQGQPLPLQVSLVHVSFQSYLGLARRSRCGPILEASTICFPDCSKGPTVCSHAPGNPQDVFHQSRLFSVCHHAVWPVGSHGNEIPV